MAGASTSPIIDDFEPYCKWKKEDEKDTLEVHLHGFRKEQVRVQLSSTGTMSITGERRVDESRLLRFRKEIKVPKECNTKETQAKLSAGILYIIMPKKAGLPSINQDQVKSPSQNQENEQAKPKIDQDDVTKDTKTKELAGAGGNTMTTEKKPTSSTLMQLKDSVSKLKMGTKMPMNVAVIISVMVAFVAFAIYKYRQPSQVIES